MKKNSHPKSSFRFLFALIALLAIGVVFGKEVLFGILIWIAISMVAIFVIGISIVIAYNLKEDIAERKKRKEEETLPN